MKDSLGDRQKTYENVYRHYLIRRMPVIIRIDGKAFSSFTRGCNRPFDQDIINCMTEAALAVAKEMQGFCCAYVQSDEASFLLVDYQQLETEAWFDNNVNKLVSISASIMTARFNELWAKRNGKLAHFDSRAFNVPREDVSNYFLWRNQDWERNSLQMYAQSNFSHKELHKKNKVDMHEMLHQKGKNWATDLNDQQKNGTWLIRCSAGDLTCIFTRYDIHPTYAEIAEVVEPFVSPEETDEKV